MSNPTSNFGWQMPTPTDLVTDLPADFEVFGQAVDSSLADLKGGTTGQVLSKNSNTDMDFVWVTNADGDITGVTAGTGISGGGTSGTVTITNSMATEITAKGDLIVGTGSATFDNLAAGANGETLVADSAATTGLRYSATPSASNPVLNSTMQVAQRGTSFTAVGFSLDRWYINGTANMTVSRQATGDTTNLPFIQYCARVARNVSSTSTQQREFTQSFESINSIPFAGKTVTFSFYARKGANYSSSSNGLSAILISGTGTDQNRGTGAYTGEAYPASVTATLTTTWQRFTATGTVGATATELCTYFAYEPSGTAGAADYFEVTGVQVDIGSVALPFRTYAATFQEELAACQRYYFRQGGSVAYHPLGWAIAASATSCYYYVYPAVQMRVAPTAIEYSTLGVARGGGLTSISALGIGDATPNITNINVTSSGMTTDAMYRILTNNSTSGYFALYAEL